MSNHPYEDKLWWDGYYAAINDVYSSMTQYIVIQNKVRPGITEKQFEWIITGVRKKADNWRNRIEERLGIEL